jgi:hypothetical protein
MKLKNQQLQIAAMSFRWLCNENNYVLQVWYFFAWQENSQQPMRTTMCVAFQ